MSKDPAPPGANDPDEERSKLVAQLQQRLSLGESPIASLDGVASGRYEITTEHGTRYLLDLDARVAIRRGAPGRGWDGSDRGFGGPITPDGKPFHYDVLVDVSVGKRMYMEDRRSSATHDEWRLSSMVVRIERVGPDPDPIDERRSAG